MENAVEALKMAFAVMFFIGAVSVSVFTFSKARETSDILLYSRDNTNFYDYIEADHNNKNRIVGVETIIPTLYRYYKENYTVQFKTGRLVTDEDGITELETTGDLILYQTKTNPNNWNKTYTKTGTSISCFDVDEENKRHEPWSGNVKDIKLNLDAFINGERYNYQFNERGNPVVWMDYRNFNGKNAGFYAVCNNNRYQFVETLGEYASGEVVYKTDSQGNPIFDKDGHPQIDYESTDSSTIIEVDGEIVNLLKPKKKRIITYTLING